MPNRRDLLIGACAGAAVTCRPAVATTHAATPSPAAHAWLPQSRRVGNGTLRVLGFTVYDASLFALANFDAGAYAAHPLVLEIRYRHSFTGTAIADYSLQQMRRSGPVDDTTTERWLQFMLRAFPDVRSGDRLTGQWLPGAQMSRFATNDGAPVTLQDAGFGPRFFGIWLAPHTPRPDMREQLLGLKSKG